MPSRIPWLRLLLTAMALCLGVGAATLAARAGADASSTPAVELHLDTIEGNGYSPDGTTPMGPTPDSSGNGQAATASGTIVDGGRFGKALYMGEYGYSDNGVTVADNTLLRPTQITVMAWINRVDGPGADRLIVGKPFPPGGCHGLSYGITSGDNNGLRFVVTTDQGGAGDVQSMTPETDPSVPWDGHWHAVAASYDGSTMRLWVDGVLKETTAVGNYPLAYDTSTGDAGLTDVFAGQSKSPSGCDESQLRYDGQIDEIRVYDRALSQDEISYLQDPNATLPPELPAPGTTSSSSSSTTSTTPSTTTLSTTATTGTTTTRTTTKTTSTQGPPLPPLFPRPSSQFTVPPALLLHLGQQTTLTPTNAAGATQLQWSVNGRPTATCSAQAPSLTTQFLGNSTVTLTASGPGGSSTTSLPVFFGSSRRKPNQGAQNLISSTAMCSTGAVFTPSGASQPQGTVDTTAQGGPPAGCNTSVTAGIVAATGCFAVVSDPRQVPLPETGILISLAHDLQTDGSFRAAAGYACSNVANCTTLGSLLQTVNGHRVIGRTILRTVPLYISHKPVRINGIDFTPLPGGSIVVSPAFGRVVSADALVQVHGVPILRPGPVNLDISDKCNPCGRQRVQIASFDSRGLPGLGSFPVTGQADISLVENGDDRYSEINLHVQLPPEFGSITADGKLRTDNTHGITLENFHFHLDKLGFDGIEISDVSVIFQAPGDWAFYGDIAIGTVNISLIPDTDHPLNGVVFLNGAFAHAGVYVNLEDSPPEIAPGVFLNSLAASFQEHPSAIRGQVTLTAADIVSVTGSVLVAFPTPAEHFQALPSDLPGAPASVLNNSYYQSPVVGVGGSVGIQIPALGTLKLGSAYVLYAYPGYVAAGGQIAFSYKDVFSIDGGIDGQINFSNKRYSFDGYVNGCVEDLGCVNVTGAVSDRGIGLCAGDWGGGFLWSDFPDPHIYGHVLGIGKRCLVSRFEDDHVFQSARQARAARALPHAALAPVTETVSRNNPMQAIQLDGSTGAVNVAVTGPQGSLAATGPGVHRAPGILVLQSDKLHETVVSFEGGPGRYTITPLPGPTIVASSHAMQAKPMTVTGKVTGSGIHRVLHYVIADRPGERVTFLNHVHGGDREIGAASAARGTVRFTTPPGTDARTIRADISVNGVPIPTEQNKTVARYRGPRLVTPGPVHRLHGRWHGSALTVGWKRAVHAVSYVVAVREHRGVVEQLATRGRSVRLTDVRPFLAGRITVTAISADGSRGAAATLTYRPLTVAPDRFLPYSELLASTRTRAKQTGHGKSRKRA